MSSRRERPPPPPTGTPPGGYLGDGQTQTGSLEAKRTAGEGPGIAVVTSMVTQVSRGRVVVEGVDAHSQAVDVEERLQVRSPVHPVRDVHLPGEGQVRPRPLAAGTQTDCRGRQQVSLPGPAAW